MNSRQQQKLDTRNYIIETAIARFSKDGLTKTRTSDIAKDANVSHGTIFAHFPTREDLLNTVIEEFGMKIARRMNELIDNDCSIKELLTAHLKGIGEYEEFYIKLISESSLLHKSAKNTIVMIQSTISFQLLQLAEKEMELNTIKKMPVNLMFNTWIGIVNYYLINKDLFAPTDSVILRYSEQLVEHFINIISI